MIMSKPIILKPTGIGLKKGSFFQLYLSTNAQNFFHTDFRAGALARSSLFFPVTFNAPSSIGSSPAAIALSSSSIGLISLLKDPFMDKFLPSKANAAICVGCVL